MNDSYLNWYVISEADKNSLTFYVLRFPPLGLVTFFRAQAK